ncbi:MAG: RNA 2'-phosphotransferase [Candidatus Thermoplasmatota archaeon]|nr:RNA 2'-phosphotransferase [Candidatus Thermoplasmatota archaeon]
MLKECRSHGFFRGEVCPNCGDQGKFLLNEEELNHLGRTMAGILRHFPQRYGLEMTHNGWVDLQDLVTALRIRHRKFRFLKSHHLIAVVQTDPKGRYQFDEGRVRATYAHSLDLEMDLPTDNIPEVLYYPTTEEEAGILLEIGLKPSDRRWVHLSDTLESAMEAGRVRSDSPVILEVDVEKAQDAGVEIQKAGKFIYITTEVPPEFLEKWE